MKHSPTISFAVFEGFLSRAYEIYSKCYIDEKLNC